ncbi:polyhydroxyalkanoate synthesis repressor PhaR [Brachymonas chironomi]|uniref:polyhydroxyalkanoate synthesis repressor PhaR n=1 Tax=Brachymonas chironomi TaxID=491919 RepID=UPI00036C0B4A|nr:polyhydroxyalkanoate synthesis repressor PhaR [Brachymonas chironomi]
MATSKTANPSRQTDAPADAAAAATASDPSLRIIKKYPNRRLYDTTSSSYVTLAEVKALVMQGERFVVRDAKSGDDLTRSILLQIILEEEAGGSPIFTETVLANIIRFYGHAMQGFFGANLESNIQAFADMQKKMMEMTPGFNTDAWSKMMEMPGQKMVQSMMQNYSEQSKQAMQQMQEQLQHQYQTNMQQWLAAFQPKR